MKLAAVAVAVSLCAASAAWACGNSMRAYDRKVDLVAQRHLNEAKKALEAGRYDDAVTLAGRARDSLGGVGEPNRGRILRWADRVEGVSQLALGHPREAVEALRDAAAGFKNDAFLTAKLGQALVESGELGEGRKLLEGLVADELIPDAGAWLALAQAREVAGDKQGALDAARRALQQDPANAKAKALVAKLSEPPPAVKPAAKATTKPST